MALIKRIGKETLRNEWRTICLVFAQLVVLVLIVMQALQAIGLRFLFDLKRVVFEPSANPMDFIILAIAVLLFALLYFEVKKRNPMLFAAEKKAPGIIKETAKQKLSKIKTEPQAPALLFIDFLFVVVVVLALKAYFDPQEELIPWSKAGIYAPYTTIINAVIAAIALAAFYCLYSFTASYRKR